VQKLQPKVLKNGDGDGDDGGGGGALALWQLQPSRLKASRSFWQD
jgi:hypothetical protein